MRRDGARREGHGGMGTYGVAALAFAPPREPPLEQLCENRSVNCRVYPPTHQPPGSQPFPSTHTMARGMRACHSTKVRLVWCRHRTEWERTLNKDRKPRGGAGGLSATSLACRCAQRQHSGMVAQTSTPASLSEGVAAFCSRFSGFFDLVPPTARTVGRRVGGGRWRRSRRSGRSGCLAKPPSCNGAPQWILSLSPPQTTRSRRTPDRLLQSSPSSRCSPAWPCSRAPWPGTRTARSPCSPPASRFAPPVCQTLHSWPSILHSSCN